MSSMNEKVKNILKYAVSILLAAVLLYFSFKDVEWKNFWTALSSCRWGYVVLSMLIGIVAFWARGLRWRELLLPIDGTTRKRTCFNAVNISYVVNMVLPRVGEIARCGYITKHSAFSADGRRKATVDKVLGTVIVDRFWDVVMLVVVFAAVFVLMWKRFGVFFSKLQLPRFSGGGSALMIIAAVAIVVLLLFFAWKKRNSGGLLSKIWGVVNGIWQGIGSCLRMKSWWKFILYTLTIWVCYWFMSYTIVLAVKGMDLSSFDPSLVSSLSGIKTLDLRDALFLMIAGSLGSLVPVPGGFGAFHYVISLALSTVYGIPTEIGIIFATLSHESQALIQIICGGLSYAYETLHKENGEKVPEGPSA